MHIRRKRQYRVPVLQNDDALLGDLLSNPISVFDVGNLISHRMIEQACCEDGAQNAVDVLIDLVLRNWSARRILYQ